MDDAQPTIRVLLAEDDPLARRAVDNYLSRAADIELIGVAVDGEQAVKLATELRPDAMRYQPSRQLARMRAWSHARTLSAV